MLDKDNILISLLHGIGVIAKIVCGFSLLLLPWGVFADSPSSAIGGDIALAFWTGVVLVTAEGLALMLTRPEPVPAQAARLTLDPPSEPFDFDGGNGLS